MWLVYKLQLALNFIVFSSFLFTKLFLIKTVFLRKKNIVVYLLITDNFGCYGVFEFSIFPSPSAEKEKLERTQLKKRG